MKIMIAVHTYYPEKNGVQQVTQYIAEGLAKNHEVLVLSNWYEGMQRTEKYQGVRIERLIANRNIFHVFCGEKQIYIDRIQSYQPDVLISVCTQSWPFDWIKNSIDNLSCVKVLYTHGYSELEKKYEFWKLLFLGKFGKSFNTILNSYYYKNAYKYISKFDLVTYLTETDKSFWYAEKHSLTNGKILSNAIEDRFFLDTEDIHKLSEKDGCLRYLYIAAYSDKKGQEMVLRSYYMANCEQSKLIFCGQTINEYYKHLVDLKKQLDEEYGKREVEFLYGKSREDILQLYRSSDIFVCGSEIEAFSISLCEAAASKMAIISTDVGHAATIPEVYIVNSIEEMAKKMTYLYVNRNELKRRAHALMQYADINCKISDKVDWLNKEIERLVNDTSKSVS